VKKAEWWVSSVPLKTAVISNEARRGSQRVIYLAASHTASTGGRGKGIRLLAGCWLLSTPQQLASSQLDSCRKGAKHVVVVSRGRLGFGSLADGERHCPSKD